jgi:tetratricopeptide (TPR) repeat protein
MLAAKQRPMPRPRASARPAPKAAPIAAKPALSVAKVEPIASVAPIAKVALVKVPVVDDLEAPAPKPAITHARKDDLQAIAQLGRDYLESGSAQLAKVIFEGLTALAPEDAYFATLLGLAADRLGDKNGAAAAFQRAIVADPKCPRVELDLAELYLEADRPDGAKQHLRRALEKARSAKDRPIFDKAEALLALLTTR